MTEVRAPGSALLANGSAEGVKVFPNSTLALLVQNGVMNAVQSQIGDTQGFCEVNFYCDSNIGTQEEPEIVRQIVYCDVTLPQGIISTHVAEARLEHGGDSVFDPANNLRFFRRYAVDPKGRLTIPQSFLSNYSGKGVVFTTGPCQTLLVVVTEVWSEWVSLSINNNRFLEQYYCLSDPEVKMPHEKTGRTLISRNVREHARINIGEDVDLFVLTGCPGLLVGIPTVKVEAMRSSGHLSLAAQRITFDTLGLFSK